ncbi:MAG: DUF4386 domain-containing protein [Actinomycetia bacterium]|nr:DUF4386 domain-containing protein [Actinomycetes bacterium]
MMADSTLKSADAQLNAAPGNEPSPGAATLRLLGAAFLVQAIGSAVSGLVLAPVDLLANSAPDDMVGTMSDIADGESLLRASIIGEMVTAAGIVALGTLLFAVLRRHGRNIAAVALGLYLVEAALLAMREVLVFALWATSEQAATNGVTEALTAQATMLYEAQAFAYSLHTLVFAAGATIFYILFARSGLLPRVLVGLGLVAAPLALIGQALVVLGVDVPLYVFIPNLPFELGAGLWLVLRGHRIER